MKDNIDVIFNPKSIAIIGASNNVAKSGGRPLKYLLEQSYKGRIYPVNPKNDIVQGLKCYPNINSIEEDIDLVIIGVPAEQVLKELNNCARKGVKAAVIFTSGFGEMGEDGKKLQDELSRFSKDTGLRILGPNCLGVINFKEKATATFTTALEDKRLVEGSVFFGSQSGAFGAHIFAMARNAGIGFNYWVTTGNEADIQLNECIKFAATDESTRVICCYLEDVRDGNKFKESIDLCISNEKPVVLLKVGQTSAGSKAAASHTGALAGNSEVYRAFFKQKGIIEASTVDELLDFAAISALEKKPKGNRVCIITSSGGAGVLLADKCEDLGLKLAELTQDTKTKLSKVLPEFGSLNNPVDVTGQVIPYPELFGESIRLCIEDPGVDVVVVFLGLFDSIGKQVVEALTEINRVNNKPLVVTWVAGPNDAIEALRKESILVFPEPVRCIKAVNAVVKYYDSIKNIKKGIKKSKPKSNARKKEIKDWLIQLIKKKKRYLSEYESRKVLQAYDIPVVEGDLGHDLMETLEIANKIGYPVVLKVDSAEILHKSDVGGVILNIKNDEELREGYNRIIENIHTKLGCFQSINGVLVEKMERFEVETIIGLKMDKIFGPSIAFGLGGIFVEIFKDIALRVAPLSRYDVEVMISSIKGCKVLQGARGKEKCDIESIVNVLLKFSDLAYDMKEIISELDINPLLVCKEGMGVKAADALIVLQNK